MHTLITFSIIKITTLYKIIVRKIRFLMIKNVEKLIPF